MYTRHSCGIIVAAILFIACLVLIPERATAQDYFEHEAECIANQNTRAQALQNREWQLLASSARWYLTYCRDQFSGDEEPSTLSDLGIALTQQGKSEDAIPILEKCAAIKPDAAYCFTDLGLAFEDLGRMEDARKAYQQAISIGGYDEINASAIGFARRELADLPSEAQPPSPTTSSEGTAPVPVESEKFGTGFFVSVLGDILTNNHVIDGCKALKTHDGKALKVLDANTNSDLALLHENNIESENSGRESGDWISAARRPSVSGTAILLHNLRHSMLTDEERQRIWDAYHVVGNKDAFVRSLNTLPLPDDTKQSLYDMRYKRFTGVVQLQWIPETPTAVFRAGAVPKLGDSVVAFGFPLPGILSSGGNVSTGIISATSGLGNDARFIQISAPVQPGNSGGPLFDSSGHVIGIVVAKLDALKVAQVTGDIPQNVNFAVRWSEVKAFLDKTGVQYRKDPSQHATSTRNIAAAASRIAVEIECTQ